MELFQLRKNDDCKKMEKWELGPSEFTSDPLLKIHTSM